MPVEWANGQPFHIPVDHTAGRRERLCRAPPRAFLFPSRRFLDRISMPRGRSPIFGGSDRSEESAMTDRALRVNPQRAGA